MSFFAPFASLRQIIILNQGFPNARYLPMRVSLPARSLRIFERWRTINAALIATPATRYGVPGTSHQT